MIQLSKITLTKPDQSHRLSLEKADQPIRVTARWIDNGDGKDDNDDLDLRAGLLMPDGRMQWVACSHPGSLEAHPFARHLGDVRSASVDAPGEEIIEVSPEISQRLGGAVALVFSVYSAISNGPVSIASLKPEMSIEYGPDRVDCALDFNADPKATQKAVYTYVIGVVEIDGASVSIRPSGLVSDPGSEKTPWLAWQNGRAVESMTGAPVFKSGKGVGLMGRMFGMDSKNKYANV
jgi:tellurite resistance protein TerA